MLEMFNSLDAGAYFSAAWDDVYSPGFWAGVLQIIGIDILLAGDNALVIALACRRLPPRLRIWGMAAGAGVAVLLRIVLTLLLATLMTLPGLKIAGGLALFYVAIKLLIPEEDGEDESQIQASEKLWQAVRIIAVADLVMSLDNVIAIAAASRGHPLLFIFGLAVSIPLVVAGARLLMTLLERFPALIWAGGALLGWIAGQVIATDPAIRLFLDHRYGYDTAYFIEILAAIAGAVVVAAAGWRLRSGPVKPV
jgi:YjbE family integral membrane protein